jgi:cyclophilin family peptidyl-prolyl cis-trans isomerase
MAKYGTGVIRVQMDLIFPGDTDKNGSGLRDTSGPSTIVMEMAPLDLMPHSVYTFLEMVSSGLLDGCSFILNALHVLKAAPLPYDGTSASDKARAFLEHGLESVAFREYSPQFPHAKYTVGFAADGSPSFYINSEDNREIHAGDPCFAKVISGFDTIQRLEKMPTRNGIWFEHRIGIRTAVIL